MTTYRRTQAGDRKLAQLLACEPARPSRGGERAPDLSLSPARLPENASNGLDASSCNIPGLQVVRVPPGTLEKWAKTAERGPWVSPPVGWVPTDAYMPTFGGMSYLIPGFEAGCGVLVDAVECEDGFRFVRCNQEGVLGVGMLVYCRDHARKLVLSLENALAFAEGESDGG